eukprot:TRINITY_DN51996_c0_g1_i1.p1 TRINITY_DN51996_c0_g1~~TRINITY_DN51996_c0_g1_i1.p1  ORF type:complete len:307 (+),score=36.50 TRINITY_DN51996_c0_g1_i1:403-1323(+)
MSDTGLIILIVFGFVLLCYLIEWGVAIRAIMVLRSRRGSVQFQFHSLVVTGFFLQIVQIAFMVFYPDVNSVHEVFSIIWENVRLLAIFFIYLSYLSIGFFWIELFYSLGVTSSGPEGVRLIRLHRMRSRGLLVFSVLNIVFFSGLWIACCLLNFVEIGIFIIYVVYFPILAVSTAVVFLVYGRRLTRELVKIGTTSLVSTMKRRLLRSIGRVGFVGTVFFAVRGVFGAFWNTYARFHVNQDTSTLVVLLFYWVFDVVPMAFILTILRPKKSALQSVGPRDPMQASLMRRQGHINRTYSEADDIPRS